MDSRSNTGQHFEARIRRGVLMGLSSVEICAGAGGQALGLELLAGFDHTALVEIERP